jgi:hypothetical protein
MPRNPEQRTHVASYSVPAALLAGSLVFSRPGLLGELFAPFGLALAALAALTAFANTRKITWSPLTWTVLIFLGAAEAWVFLRHENQGIATSVQGSIVLIANLLAASVVLSDRRAALLFGRIFVWAMILMSISGAITAALWYAGSSFILFTFPTGQWITEMRFPFSPTVGVVQFSGMPIPRFTGLGREPGWMGMFIAFAVFLWRHVGRPRWWGYLALTVGLLCTLSTAGFGVFVTVLAYEYFLRPRSHRDPFLAYIRQLAGLAAMVGAVWVALFAPVFGFVNKAQTNNLSYEERTNVTSAGWEALVSGSLGEPTGVANSHIGLIAATAENGWPYFVLMVFAFLVPLAAYKRPVAPVFVLFLTVLVAQPPRDSVGVYLLLLAAFACAPPRETIQDRVSTSPSFSAERLRRHDRASLRARNEGAQI